MEGASDGASLTPVGAMVGFSLVGEAVGAGGSVCSVGVAVGTSSPGVGDDVGILLSSFSSVGTRDGAIVGACIVLIMVKSQVSMC